MRYLADNEFRCKVQIRFAKRCKCCEHEWNAQSDKPKRCPSCGTGNWSEAKVREVKLIKSEWTGDFGDDYRIDCECGSMFYGELVFDKNEFNDETIVECSECYRRYKVRRVISIEPMEDNKELKH